MKHINDTPFWNMVVQNEKESQKDSKPRSVIYTLLVFAMRRYKIFYHDINICWHDPDFPPAAEIWSKPLFVPCALPLGGLAYEVTYHTSHDPSNVLLLIFGPPCLKHGGPKIRSKINRQIKPKSVQLFGLPACRNEQWIILPR